MNFEWDADKADANFEKHEISFHDAVTVFADPLSTSFPDPDHSEGEQRFLTIGVSQSGALLVIAHREGRRDPDHQRASGDTARAQIL